MNKQGIRDQLKGLLNRNDITDSIANTFIDQAVARIQRTLRIPPMEKSVIYTATVANPEVLTLPTDFLQLKHIFVSTGTLTYTELNTFMQFTPHTGVPKYYTRVQGALKVFPEPTDGTQITMVYYGEIPDLVNDTDTNFLTDIAPDLLVYGALSYACDFYVDDRKEAFDATFSRIYAELVEQSEIFEMNQSGLSIAPMYTYAEY